MERGTGNEKSILLLFNSQKYFEKIRQILVKVGKYLRTKKLR